MTRKSRHGVHWQRERSPPCRASPAAPLRREPSEGPCAVIKCILGPRQPPCGRILDYFLLWQQEVWDKAFPILVPALYEWPLKCCGEVNTKECPTKERFLTMPLFSPRSAAWLSMLPHKSGQFCSHRGVMNFFLGPLPLMSLTTRPLAL